MTSFKSFCSSKYHKTKYNPIKSSKITLAFGEAVVSKDEAKLKNISGIYDYHELGDFSGK